MQRQVDQKSISDSIGRVGKVVFVELIITVPKQVVRNALPLQIQQIHIQKHSLFQIRLCRILPHIVPDFFIRDIIVQRTHLVSLARRHPIGQLHFLPFVARHRGNGGAHIAHVAHCFSYLVPCTLGFILAVNDRGISHSVQYAVDPARTVAAGHVVNIKLGFHQTEPFGIRILPDIKREAGRLYILVVRMYAHLVQQIGTFRHILGGRARSP